MHITKSLLVGYSLSCVSTLWSSTACADSAALAVTLGLHDVYHNAEFNPTGNPIGGGAGYSRIVDTTKTNVVVVDNMADLVRAITTAVSGAVIYVRDNAEIDMTSAGTITIPGGVTLASSRGKDSSRGAKLYVTKESREQSLFRTGGANVRITGLRIQGPDDSILPDVEHSTGVQVVSQDSEIDNCEIYGWTHAGINGRENGSRLKVRHNYIHNNHGWGQGYGVMLQSVEALIEANYFDYHRHSIAGEGKPGTSYEARYNVFGVHHLTRDRESSVLVPVYPVDMHGGGDREETNNDAGDWIVVHHNTFYQTHYELGGVHISGVPRVGAWIFSNWFEKSPTVTQRKYTNPGVPRPDLKCLPCAGTTNLEKIFAFKNRSGITQWGATLPWLNDRDHVGDFNGDGLLDWITFASNGDFLVRKRIPWGGFETFPRRWGRNGSDLPDKRRYRIADVNGDSRADVISFEANGGIYVWIATAKGRFDGPLRWGSNGADIGAIRYKIGDFNGDRRADIVSFESNKNFYIWLAQPGGGFQGPFQWGSNGADYGTTDIYRVADVNGDNRSDIVSIEGARFFVWKSFGNAFGTPAQWGSNGAVLGTYQYQLGNAGAGILSDVISFEPNAEGPRKYIWNSNGINQFALWGDWFLNW